MCYNKLMHKNRNGFTLIELSLSLAFISVLAIIIALIATNMTATYQRGLILKQVNTVGNDLIDDIRGAIAGSSAKSITSICYTTYKGGTGNVEACSNDNAQSFISLTRTANVNIRIAGNKNTPVFGMFCSGTYSYLWNSGYFFGDDYSKPQGVEKLHLTYTNANGDIVAYPNSNQPPIRLLKVLDPSRAVCAASIGGTNYATSGSIQNDIKSDIDITGYGLVTESPVDLLSSDSLNSDLAIYDFTVARPAQDALTENALYSGSFIIGSIKGGIDVKASGDYCATPADYTIEDFNYCAINKFNFAIRATGE